MLFPLEGEGHFIKGTAALLGKRTTQIICPTGYGPTFIKIALEVIPLFSCCQ